MDRELTKMERRRVVGFVSAEEIIAKRTRAGVCALCAKSMDGACGCIGTYVYEDKDGEYRLRRNRRSTLPCGVVGGVLNFSLEVLFFMPRAPRNMNLERGEDPKGAPKGSSGTFIIPFDKIVDIDIAVLSGIDVGEAEKRRLGDYLDVLETTSDLYSEQGSLEEENQSNEDRP